MRSIGGRQAEGFQNDQVVIHVVRNSRAASVVTEVMAGHRPTIWVSDLNGAQQGHADLWQICLRPGIRFLRRV
jgi:transposase